MKKIIFTLLLAYLSLTTFGQKTHPKKVIASQHADSTTIVQAGCGQCQFKLKGNGCHLAVRIKGKAYFVDGTDIDDHGDAHASDGLCNAVRTAMVKGEITNNRFKATYFKLVPTKKE